MTKYYENSTINFELCIDQLTEIFILQCGLNIVNSSISNDNAPVLYNLVSNIQLVCIVRHTVQRIFVSASEHPPFHITFRMLSSKIRRWDARLNFDAITSRCAQVLSHRA